MPRFLVVILCTGLIVAGALRPAAAQENPPAKQNNPPAKRPNVVMFVADDLGFQAGCYGDSAIRTPGMDQLAAEGTRYTRAYCTTSSCSPSRSVILSGRFSHATGQYGLQHGYNRFESQAKMQTLPVLLAEAGYRTCSIGKFHVAPEETYHFETYRNEGTQGNRNPVRMAQNAKEWIAEKDERPFFLYLCTSDPHRSRVGFANLRGEKGYVGVNPVRYQPENIPVPSWLPDLPDVRSDLAEFYESITRMDQGLAVLLDALRETGHWDDTVIIFLSDNGPPFPGGKTTVYEPGINLPLIVRAPDQPAKGVTCDALVSWVDLAPTILDYCGALTDEPKEEEAAASAGAGDSANKAAGVRKPAAGKKPNGARKTAELHGRSFRATVGRPHAEGFDEVFASHTFHEITMYYPMRSVIRGKYKYIFNVAHQLPYPFASDLYASPTWQAVLKENVQQYGKRSVDEYLHRPRHELYDLEADPDEIHNLADDPRHAETLREMQARMKEWQKQTSDPWVLKWDRE